MIFQTKRCIIRLLEMYDLDAYHEMQSNPLVMQYADGDCKTIEGHRKELAELIANDQKEVNLFRIWAIQTKDKDAFIGTVALITDEANHTNNELGIRFLEKHWNKGYGYEVMTELIRYAVEELNMASLVAYVDNRNKGSIAILEKSVLDFQKMYWNEDDQCDELLYSKTF